MPLFAPLNPPLPAWPDARVWVIGASYGIGAATAQALLARRRAGRAVGALRRQARGGGRRPHAGPGAGGAARLHAGRRRSPRRGRASARAWGGCDLVLVVAGTHREFRAWDLTEADADALLETNLNGRWRPSPRCCPACIAQGRGAIGIVSQRRRLPRTAEGAGLRRVEGGADQLHRDALPRPASAGHRRVPHQPRLRRRPRSPPATSSAMPHLITADEAATRDPRRASRAATSRSTSRARSRASSSSCACCPTGSTSPLVRKATGECRASDRTRAVSDRRERTPERAARRHSGDHAADHGGDPPAR